MRLEFHGDELEARFPFQKVPDGDYEVRTTAHPDDGEPFDFLWPVTLKDGTLTAHTLDDWRGDRMKEFTVNPREEALIRRMAQQSTEMWLATRDRTQPGAEVVICERPGRAFYLSWIGNVEGNINGWKVDVRALDSDDAKQFFEAFGTHWPYWIGATIRGGEHPVRAYIKNGRRDEWSISIGPSS